ncbi:NHL repeat-containing protein [Stenotrophomonas sp. SY1]|uniref:NHL repeat-containing protein n=1 Tax=Stenotrophomonas sp. SY1 TaxID=477235 RepID=UPI001E603430|nr:NHL repeat-containing protein [Stenotrophomonas sp. SY1]MCD9085726.1 gluconolaconase [Stenotrophomonas sp. SY1]
MERKYWISAVVVVTGAALAASFLWVPTPKGPVGPAPTPLGWQASIELLGGDGIAGNSAGSAAQTRFSDPWGVVMGGSVLFVADAGDNNRIVYRGLDGAFHLLAGGREGFADGQGAAAAFNTPSGIALDRHGNLYVADTGNHAIRKVTPQGQVSTVAGNGMAGFADGTGAQARFDGPMGVAVGADDRIYVADTWNDRIRVIEPDGRVWTLAGGERPGWEDGAGPLARFDTPTDVALDAQGNVWVADLQNNALRIVSPQGMVSTRVGTPGGERLLWGPMAVALTHDGVAYISERLSGRVVQLSPSGHMVAVAGNDAQRFARPAGVAVAADGSLLLADADAHRVHHLRPLPVGVEPPLVQLGPSPDNPLPRNEKRWPLAPQTGWHEVTGTLGEVRGNFSGESRHHLHSGFDVRGDVGQTVLAVAPGKVSSPASTWTLGGQAEGFSLDKLDYIHMKVGRDASNRPLDAKRFQLVNDEHGQLDRVRVRRGTRFQPGDALGSINNQAHVHLAVGPSGYERNAVRLGFANYADHVAPKIDDIALLDANDQRLKDTVDGRLRVARDGDGLQLVVEAWDQVDNNLPRRRLGLYTLGYQILDSNGRALPGYEQPRMNIIFNRMPPQREAVKVAYAADSGITVHGSSSTRFRYVLTNTVRDGLLSTGLLQPAELLPGNYTVRVTAKDYSGNEAASGRELQLQVE